MSAPEIGTERHPMHAGSIAGWRIFIALFALALVGALVATTVGALQ